MGVAQPTKQMSKKIIDSALMGLLLTAIFEVGILMGIYVVKSHIFLSPASISSINGLPKALIVTSGSMEPTIKTGGLVISVPLSSYKVGDVVSFENGTNGKTIVTHRIQTEDYSSVSNQLAYITKGDANKTIDETKITRSQIIGRVIVAFPQLGYFANSVKDPKIFILLVIVPATIVVYEELKFLKKQFLKKIGLFLNKFKSDEDNDSNKLFIFVPIFSTIFILAGITGSFFTDSKTNEGFNINTGIFTPPTPPPHVVVNEVFTNGGNTGSNWKGQFIELYNQSDTAVDINGWSLTDVSGPNTISTALTIPAHTYVVVVGNQYNGPDVPSSATKIVLSTQKIGSNGLDGIGDFVQLKNGAIIIDQMSYGTGVNGISVFNPAPASPTSSQSVYRHPNGADTDTINDWFTNSPTTVGITNP